MQINALSSISSHSIFTSMLAAISRPGKLIHISTDQDSAVPSCITLLLAMIDVETKFNVIETTTDLSTQGSDLVAAIGSVTGAPFAPVTEADWVAALREPTANELMQLQTGSALIPECGARLIVLCRELSNGLHHSEGQDDVTAITLVGPGINETTVFTTFGISVEFFSTLGQINSSFPAGVDVWLVDKNFGIVSIPRSSDISILSFTNGAQ